MGRTCGSWFNIISEALSEDRSILCFPSFLLLLHFNQSDISLESIFVTRWTMLNVRNYTLLKNNNRRLFGIWMRSLYSAWYNFMIVVASFGKGRYQRVDGRILLAASALHSRPLYHVCRPKLNCLNLNWLYSNSLFSQLKWRHLTIHYIISSPPPHASPLTLHFYFTSIKLNQWQDANVFFFFFYIWVSRAKWLVSVS